MASGTRMAPRVELGQWEPREFGRWQLSLAALSSGEDLSHEGNVNAPEGR